MRGDRTSRIWKSTTSLSIGSATANAGRAEAFDDGSLALLHRLEKGTYWDDEVERARSAIALAIGARCEPREPSASSWTRARRIPNRASSALQVFFG